MKRQLAGCAAATSSLHHPAPPARSTP